MQKKQEQQQRLYSSADLVYSVIEAADILRTSETRIYQLINAGILRTITIGSQKIRRSDLEFFVANYDIIMADHNEEAENVPHLKHG